jgi:hypothetical protein
MPAETAAQAQSATQTHSPANVEAVVEPVSVPTWKQQTAYIPSGKTVAQRAR